MRNDGVPFYLPKEGKGSPLQRIHLTEKAFRENFLQIQLHAHPEILPVRKWNPLFAPLVSLGKEIMGIDNLFISPEGYLTLVETKLWRNPQAVREVLAQILDYASRLVTLSVEELETACQTSKHGVLTKGQTLYSFLSNQFPTESLEEAEFHDRLQHHLRSGRFLLLIVGDGIREDLERILEQLHRNAQWHFSFGLVELQVYQRPDEEDFIIFPYRIAHSAEIVRSVVKVEGNLPAHIQITPTDSVPGKERQLDEHNFLENLSTPALRKLFEAILEWAKGKLEPRVTKKSIGLWLQPPAIPAPLIMIRIYQDGRILLAPPRLPKQMEQTGLDPALLEKPYQEIQTLFGVTGNIAGKDATVNTLPWSTIQAKLEPLLNILESLRQELLSAEPTATEQIPEIEEESED